MQIEPITEIDVYRATLAACVKAEASEQTQLAQVLRAWVDASPFGGCPACDGRAPWRNEPQCQTCAGDGFLPVSKINPPADRFDRLCGCALIDIWPSEEARFRIWTIAYQQDYKRKVVNNGRQVIPDVDCQKCGGTGEISAT